MLQRIAVACVMLFTISSCGSHSGKNDSAYTNDPVLFCKTVKQLNNVVLENNFPPMIASRNYAYAGIAAYEVVAVFDPRFQSLAGQIKHLPAFPKTDTAGVDYHLAAMLAFCKVGEAVTFPEGSMQEYVDKLKKGADSAGMSSGTIRASQPATHPPTRSSHE